MAQPKRLTISPKAPTARRRRASVPGEPTVILPRRNIPTAGRDPNTGVALFGKRSVRRLGKVDPSTGQGMPEVTPITATPGVVTGRARPSEMAKDPMTKTANGQRRIKAPAPGQGKLKRLNTIGPVKGR